MNAPYAPITTVFDEDCQDEAPGYAARQAEQHLRSMSPERRAFLEREWTGGYTLIGDNAHGR